ncbi:MAG: archease [Nitrospirota bacterium]|nr:archease [Nitrospirota bacterium]
MASGLIEHTADVGFWVRARGLDHLFLEALEAFEGLLAPLGCVLPKERHFFVFHEQGVDVLLHEALNELLYAFDTRRILFSRFAILGLDEGFFEFVAFGETLEPERHRIRCIPKAVTYNDFAIRQEPRGFLSVRVILDV